MIRIERKNTPKAQLAIADLQKAYKSGGTYNTDNVNAALKEMFHGKCYICENKAITSYQIEHLIPHRENKELKYVRIAIISNQINMSRFWTVQKKM